MKSAAASPGTKEAPAPAGKPLFERNHNLILWNDDVTPVNVVIQALIEFLAYPEPNAVATVRRIELAGKGIVYSGTLEICELRAEQLGGLGLTTTIESIEG